MNYTVYIFCLAFIQQHIGKKKIHIILHGSSLYVFGCYIIFHLVNMIYPLKKEIKEIVKKSWEVQDLVWGLSVVKSVRSINNA